MTQAATTVTDALVDPRIASRLTRLAFADGANAAALLAAPPLRWWDAATNLPPDPDAAAVVAALGRSADPDDALDVLARMLADPAAAGLREELQASATLRARLLGLLGVSAELGEHLAAHPADWRVLLGPGDPDGVAARLAGAVGADPADPVTGTAGTPARLRGRDAVTALRAAYRRELVAIAGRGLGGDLDLPTVTAQLSDLAGHLLQVTLAVARAELPEDAAPARLAIVAMGKTGARELNYVSDVDVIFVAEPVGEAGDEATAAALRTAAALAGFVMRLCRDIAWEVDANLRPEGKDGPLVRTLGSHAAYYERWASTWEFQALLKARPVAGDAELGAAYQRLVTPLVWTAAQRPDFVADVRAMRRRVVAHIPASVGGRDIKLGRGGLRDVEFAVQLLQLVHGRADERLRVAGTLAALAALRDGGYVGRDDAISLSDAYLFLRATEHRLQLRRLRRSHVVPTDPDELRWLARSLNFRPDFRGDALAVFESEWTLHAREVRRLHEKLFYRPLLEAVARVPTEVLRLSPEQAGNRLRALGFDDPDGALRHIRSLTAGLSRRAALQRTLLPVLLSELADSPAPDAGLLAYRALSDELGATPWYLRLLRDGDTVVPRLGRLLGTSRYVSRMLGRAPDALRMLDGGSRLRPRPHAEVLAEMLESARRQDDAAAAIRAARNVRRLELLRTAFGDLLAPAPAAEPLDVTTIGTALSTIMSATLEATLRIATRELADDHGLPELPLRFAIIAMGRLGGAELGYGSDADVMFVYDVDGDHPDGARLAQALAGRVRSLLAAPSSVDPPLIVDAGLRPEGRNGPLARSLASYAQYYARWSSPWESQALLRARPVAGDAELGAAFVAGIDPVRYPVGGLSPEQLLEIRRLKGRIDSERLPRGADPTLHAKLGRGGLGDIEWTVQLLQLQHGAQRPELHTTSTLDALAAAGRAGLLDEAQVDVLSTAWRFATRARNAVMLVRDKPEDQLPTFGTELVAVGQVLGYPIDGDPGQLVDDYRRAARRARRVVEDVFYGPVPG